MVESDIWRRPIGDGFLPRRRGISRYFLLFFFDETTRCHGQEELEEKEVSESWSTLEIESRIHDFHMMGLSFLSVRRVGVLQGSGAELRIHELHIWEQDWKRNRLQSTNDM